jgi:hypothetical protein
MTTRARKGRILVQTTNIAGKLIDMQALENGKTIVYDQATDSFVFVNLPSQVYPRRRNTPKYRNRLGTFNN